MGVLTTAGVIIKRGGIAIRLAFCIAEAGRIALSGGMASHLPTQLIMPVTQFMRDRKALPHRIGSSINGDDRPVTDAKDPGIAAQQRAIANDRSREARDHLNIDLAGSGDAKVEQQLFGRVRRRLAGV